MNPKKAKDLTEETARELGVSQELAEDLVSFYWKELHTLISDFKYPVIRAGNLGNFEVRKYKLEPATEKYKVLLKSRKPKTFLGHEAYKILEDRLKTIQDMIKVFQEEEQRKQIIKSKRNGTYYP